MGTCGGGGESGARSNGGATNEPWDASAEASTPDAQAPFVQFDAGACAESGDAGTPPPDCIAPCIWNLIANCQLSNCCGQDTEFGMPEYPFPTYDRSCDDHGVTIDAEYPFHGVNRIARRNGTVCYSTQWSYGSNTLTAPTTWVDADGYAVGTISRDGHEVLCGSEAYTVDATQPKCAPWVRTACVPGTCR
jgi:hypothetical protein